jgi:Ni,Fe-hydrogenase III small subunit
VSAGGCNAFELELNAVANVNFDAQRFGIEWVASPRHADALSSTPSSIFSGWEQMSSHDRAKDGDDQGEV